MVYYLFLTLTNHELLKIIQAIIKDISELPQPSHIFVSIGFSMLQLLKSHSFTHRKISAPYAQPS